MSAKKYAYLAPTLHLAAERVEKLQNDLDEANELIEMLVLTIKTLGDSAELSKRSRLGAKPRARGHQ